SSTGGTHHVHGLVPRQLLVPRRHRVQRHVGRSRDVSCRVLLRFPHVEHEGTVGHDGCQLLHADLARLLLTHAAVTNTWPAARSSMSTAPPSANVSRNPVSVRSPLTFAPGTTPRLRSSVSRSSSTCSGSLIRRITTSTADRAAMAA